MSQIESLDLIAKSPGEIPTFGFDFSRFFALNPDTIGSIDSIVQVDDDDEVITPTDLNIGSPVINSSATFKNNAGGIVGLNKGVKVQIGGGTLTGGVAGDGLYRVRCRVVTVGGNTLDLIGRLQVEP